MLDTLPTWQTRWMPSLPESPILIVVEGDSLRAALDFRLTIAGYATELAETGEHAIDLFRQNPRDYAAILMDRQMSGLDGEETKAVLHCIGCDAPVVFVDEECDLAELDAAIDNAVQRPVFRAQPIY